MPLLRRLFWPLLLLPAAFVGVVFLLLGEGSAWALHALAFVLAVGSFGLLYWGLRRTYTRWSALPPKAQWGEVVFPPEEVVFVSRGGFLTPGTATFTRDELKVFTAGRLLLSLPLQRVAAFTFRRGRVLRTPYVDFTASDGRRLARIGVESARSWAAELSRLRSSAAT